MKSLSSIIRDQKFKLKARLWSAKCSHGDLFPLARRRAILPMITPPIFLILHTTLTNELDDLRNAAVI